jgi:hypothetical protein
MTPIVGKRINFRQYVERVLGDPNRIEEYKVLVDLFGTAKLEAVLEGRLIINPSSFIDGSGG